MDKEKFNESRYNKDWQILKSDKPRIEAILKLVGEGNKKILDIGCYDGTISKRIKSKNNDVFGVDVSKNAIKLAEDKGIKSFKVDLENEPLPFPDEFFDVVVAGELIEHIFDTDEFLEKIWKVLKKDGYLVLTTPNLASLGRRFLLLFGKNPLIEVSCRDSAGHIRYFIKINLIKLVENHNYSVEYFCSDVVNFENSGRIYSKILAKLFPTLGKSLIIKARKCK